MEFRIQYFASHDRLLQTELVEAEELIGAIDRARDILRRALETEGAEPAELPIGYVILNAHGRSLARGYNRKAIAALNK